MGTVRDYKWHPYTNGMDSTMVLSWFTPKPPGVGVPFIIPLCLQTLFPPVLSFQRKLGSAVITPSNCMHPFQTGGTGLFAPLTALRSSGTPSGTPSPSPKRMQ
jgi:hypothetical protein